MRTDNFSPDFFIVTRLTCSKASKKLPFYLKKPQSKAFRGRKMRWESVTSTGKGWSRTIQAVKWYKKATKQGFCTAQCNLGFCYERGHGVKQDCKKAVRLYSLSAKQDHAEAQCILGYCYDSGLGIKQDYKKAVFWYQKAAAQGDTVARFNLGNCYRTGRGVMQDEKKSTRLYVGNAK